jgi:hypothetical protein
VEEQLLTDGCVEEDPKVVVDEAEVAITMERLMT